jgi:hypothetical protein
MDSSISNTSHVFVVWHTMWNNYAELFLIAYKIKSVECYLYKWKY